MLGHLLRELAVPFKIGWKPPETMINSGHGINKAEATSEDRRPRARGQIINGIKWM